jgi:hypothetical protein
MHDPRKNKFAVTVSHRLPESLVVDADLRAQRTWRDRAKVLSAIGCRVLEMVRRDGNFPHDLSGGYVSIRPKFSSKGVPLMPSSYFSNRGCPAPQRPWARLTFRLRNPDAQKAGAGSSGAIHRADRTRPSPGRNGSAAPARRDLPVNGRSR